MIMYSYYIILNYIINDTKKIPNKVITLFIIEVYSNVNKILVLLAVYRL
jgi:hypothetical protein